MKRTFIYSDFFSEPFDCEQAQKQITCEEILNLIACVFFDLVDPLHRPNIQNDFFKGLVGGFSEEERIRVTMIKNQNWNADFFHPKAILSILEKVAANRHSFVEYDSSNRAGSNQTLFKLILTENEFISNSYSSYSGLEPDFADDILRYRFDSETVIQIFKALYLFQFLNEKKSEFTCINQYQTQFGIPDFHGLLSLIISTFNSFKRNNGLVRDVILARTEENQRFFDRWATSNSETTNKIRIDLNPLFHLEGGGYIITSYPHFIDKLTDYLYFDLKLVANQISDNPFLKGGKELFGKKFFEEKLCNDVLCKIFKAKPLFVEGPADKRIKALDFYAIFDNRVFLFECKDKSIGDDVKRGECCFEHIKRKITKELYDEQGVIQLTTFISNWRQGHSAIPNDFPKYDASMIIFPVLIVSDSFFNLPKLNELLIEKFNSQDQSRLGDNVCAPVIIHIDTLISRAVAFHNSPVFFGGLLNRYITDNHYKTSSFETFLSNGACKVDDYDLVNCLLGFSKVLPKDTCK